MKPKKLENNYFQGRDKLLFEKLQETIEFIEFIEYKEFKPKTEQEFLKCLVGDYGSKNKRIKFGDYTIHIEGIIYCHSDQYFIWNKIGLILHSNIEKKLWFYIEWTPKPSSIDINLEKIKE